MTSPTGACPSLLTLISSGKRPTPSGAFPAAHFLPATSSDAVEIYRSVNYLPRRTSGSTRLHFPTPSTCLPARIFHVYVALHTNYDFCLSSSVIGYGAYRISQCVLSNNDHLQWSSMTYSDSIDTATTGPKNRALLLMRMIRALWDHRTVQDEGQLRIYLPDPALVLSINSPPHTSWSGYMRPSSSSSTP